MSSISFAILRGAGFMLASVLLAHLASPPATATESSGVPDYQRDIKPLLTRHCSSCHGVLKQESELRLDAIQLIRQGGASGEPLLTTEPSESWLLAVATGDAGFRMPPEGEGTPLEQEQIGMLRRWLAAGSPAPKREDFVEQPTDYWSYQPVARPAVPSLSPARDAWAMNPIDAFVAAEHERQGLTPHRRAPAELLLRRLYLDLIGIPPTAEQREAFLADRSVDRYEQEVDRLLASPQYGERWGRHWLDIWRYSDWYGRRGSNEIRYSQRHIWRWRDWTVKSLNEDRGYEYMIHAMLAGDELAPKDPEALAATGFLGRNWYKFDRDVWMRELVEHSAMGLLAVTMRCTRCHDHKYDPIAQEEYYRFRAFFEPHDVRIDPVGTETDLEKAGIARVYDKQLDAPTYLFQRGDDRFPDKENPLAPGVPAALGDVPLQIQPVQLPLDAWFPVQRKLAEAQQSIMDQQQALAEAEARVSRARMTLDAARAEKERQVAGQPSSQEKQAGEEREEPFLVDLFEAARPDVWDSRGGTWEYADGKLRQTTVTNWATMFTKAEHPRNFRASVRYISHEPGTYRSVGVFFDMVDTQHAQAVYTSVNDQRSSVQAFHRVDGKEQYPPEGIFPCEKIQVGQEILLEIEVRDSQLTVYVDGEKQFDYTMPQARRSGRFAIWSHSGTTDFLKVEVTPLLPTVASAEAALAEAERDVPIARQDHKVARLELKSLRSRIAAERLRTAHRAESGEELAADLSAAPADLWDEHARRAARGEAAVRIAAAERAILQTEIELDQLASDENRDPLEKKLAQQRTALKAAHEALDADSLKYTPCAPEFPQESSGRRLALARWMTDPQNPRTARVACNHIWLRHFGQALVPSVSNFGLSGKEPSHPQLLDWLASELMTHDWSLKHLHRLIVTSQTFQLHSAPGGRSSEDADRLATNQKLDPENRFLWRANYRRMEAEVVRDSLLALNRSLDLRIGGPDLPPETAAASRRRSLYFRITPNEKVEFLEIFDLANPDQCYQRQVSVVPQQVLALTNSKLCLDQARQLAGDLSSQFEGDAPFIEAAFKRILGRAPSSAELQACGQYLVASREPADSETEKPFPAVADKPRAAANEPRQRARENLVHTLLNHNDFITIR